MENNREPTVAEIAASINGMTEERIWGLLTLWAAMHAYPLDEPAPGSSDDSDSIANSFRGPDLILAAEVPEAAPSPVERAFAQLTPSQQHLLGRTLGLPGYGRAENNRAIAAELGLRPEAIPYFLKKAKAALRRALAQLKNAEP